MAVPNGWDSKAVASRRTFLEGPLPLWAVTTLLGLSPFGQAMLVVNWPFLERAIWGNRQPAGPCAWLFFFFVDLS